jgi:nitronate monooxygenase
MLSRLPRVQAPMAGAQDSRLAIAVCKAGGLGSLPCAMLSPDQARAQILSLRAAAEAQGSGGFSPLWAGEAASLAREMDAGKLTETIWREARAAASGLEAALREIQVK